jgi:hypothetical protein
MPQNHPCFQEPVNPAIKIWRYMDFAKFVSLLEDRALFFARADRLGDPFEGSFPRTNIDMRPVWYKEMIDKMGEGKFSVTLEGGCKRMPLLETLPFLHAWFCQWTFVNCWHINDFESAAMWRLYALSNQAIALQSTYERLRGCLPESVFTGQIQYLNYEADVIPESNLMWPFVHKRLSFSHEQELRALIQEIPGESGSLAIGKPNSAEGKLVPVDLNSLVGSIYVAPSAPAWYADLTRKIIARYGLSKDVWQSALDARPLY